MYRTRRKTAGFTMVEVMIGTAITSVMMVSLMGLFTISSRSIKETYGPTQMRSARMRSIDQIHYRLVNAQIGSCTVSQASHRIEFVDPNLDNVTSVFFFNAEDRTLYYDDAIDRGDNAAAVASGPIDITFELESGGAVVLINVESASHMAYGDIDLQDGQVRVFLRNV